MKLSILFLFVCLAQLLANSANGQDAVIHMSSSNLSVGQLLKEIEKQTDYLVIYSNREVDTKRNINLSSLSGTVSEYLRDIFAGTDVRHEFESDYIILTKRAVTTFLGPGQQGVTISGTVTDVAGEPLPGVNVVLKGTTLGVVTNVDGKYSTIIPDRNAVLVFSYVGYTTVEYLVEGQTQVNIVLEEDTKLIEEVVIVGYGIQKKSDLTGAIVNVKMDDMEGLPAANLTSALSGRLAGVSIMQNGGGPSPGVNIRIRGIGTLNNNNPLIVIDDIIGADLNLLNPSDIETMTVLKDASAAAIYGSRAASGVVIVKTRRGSGAEGTRVNFGAYYGWDKVSKKMDVLSAGQLATIYNEASANDGSAPLPEFTNPSSMSDVTNWQDEIFRTAHVQNYNLGISSSGTNSNLNISLNIQNYQGVLLNTYNKLYSARINSDTKIGKRLKVGESVVLSYRDSKNTNTRSDNSGAILMALAMHPDVPVYYPDGTYHGVPSSNYGDVENPVGLLERNSGYNHNYKLEGNAYVQLELMKGLTLKTSGSILLTSTDEKKFYPIKPEPGRPVDKNSLEEKRELIQKWISETTVNYDKTIAKHRISVLAGFTAEHWQNSPIKGSKRYFDLEDSNYWYLNSGSEIEGLEGWFEESGLMSVLFRANYAYDDKYLFGFNFRTDGSSKFLKGKRWGYFPSASLGWRITQESFMSDISWLSDLKIRGSFGSLGNEAVDLYSTVNTYKTGDPFGRYEFGPGGSNRLQGYFAGKMGNPDLRWETTTQGNIGFDAVFFNNSLSLTADYFYKKTEDILVAPPMLGAYGNSGAQFINGATVVNKGIEATLSYMSDRNKDFRYDLSLNFTTFTNEVTSLGNATQPIYGPTVRDAFSVTRTNVGDPIASFYGYRTDGLFASDQDAAAYVNKDGDRLLPDAKGGDFRFVDANEDGKIDANDRVVLGNAMPDFSYGLNASFYYKNFDLNLFLQGVQGADVWYSLRYQVGFAGLKYNYLSEVWDRWTPGNPGASVPRVSWTDPNNNKRPSDYYIENGSYLRLKNISLGYTFPKKWLSSIGVQQFRIYGSIQNLFTITGYPGYDPELGITDSDKNQDRESGVDRGQYPYSRTFSLGLNLSF